MTQDTVVQVTVEVHFRPGSDNALRLTQALAAVDGALTRDKTNEHYGDPVLDNGETDSS